MCDCRLSRSELLAEKQRRIQEDATANTSKSNTKENSEDANLAKLTPYPRDPNFLVFCSISLQQATKLVQANDNYITNALSEESIQAIFETCCNPKWFCSECQHPIALHSTGVLFSTSIVSSGNDNSAENSGSSSFVASSMDEVAKIASRNASDAIISDETTRHFIFCCSGGLSTRMGSEVGGGIQKVALAASAGWELQRQFDIDREAAATEKAAYEKAERERLEREKLLEEEEKKQHQIQLELFEKERLRQEAAEQERKQKATLEQEQAAIREDEIRKQQQQEQPQQNNTTTSSQVEEEEVVVNVDEDDQQQQHKKRGGDAPEESHQEEPKQTENELANNPQKIEQEQQQEHPAPSPLSPQEAKKLEQEDEIQKRERTIREQIHTISLRYGQAGSKDLSEKSEIVQGRNVSAMMHPRPPPSSSSSGDHASARLQLQQQAAACYSDEQQNKYRSVSPTRHHHPSSRLIPPAVVPNHQHIHQQQQQNSSAFIPALRGTVAPSIEDALEVSNPFAFDRWTISPVGKQQIHVSAFQQTRLGQTFDELQIRIGDFEISSVASKRDEFISASSDMARNGDSYVLMNKAANKVYFSVKGGRVGAGSVEKAVAGLEEIASKEGIYVDRLIAALPIRLQPANVIPSGKKNAYSQQYQYY